MTSESRYVELQNILEGVTGKPVTYEEAYEFGSSIVDFVMLLVDEDSDHETE